MEVILLKGTCLMSSQTGQKNKFGSIQYVIEHPLVGTMLVIPLVHTRNRYPLLLIHSGRSVED